MNQVDMKRKVSLTVPADMNYAPVVTLALSVSATETVILLYRIAVVVRNRDRMRPETKES